MPAPYLNRELSWVEFNQRVLNEALRDDIPLLERVKFLAITASNLDEFFQVRIGGLMAMKRGGMKQADASGLTPTRNLAALRQRILTMTADQYALFNDTLVPALAKAGIRLLSPADLGVEQSAQLTATFEDLVFPLLTPLAVDPGEAPQMRSVRCRTLGCYPLTGVVASEADTLPKIIAELVAVKNSERENRVIDHDREGSMELKKREGYF